MLSSEIIISEIRKKLKKVYFLYFFKNHFLLHIIVGELHIEIIKDRLRVEHKLDVFLGPLQVNYRETVGGSGEATVELQEMLQNKRQHVKITLQVYLLRFTGIFFILILDKNVVLMSSG